MAASTQALIDAFAARSPLFLLPPTSPAYDQAPLGHRASMIRMRDDIPKEDMPPQRRFLLTAPPPGCDVAESSVTAARPPRGQYGFVDTVKAGQGLIRSPGHDVRTIGRVASSPAIKAIATILFYKKTITISSCNHIWLTHHFLMVHSKFLVDDMIATIKIQRLDS
ncbi:hypothetical protein Tco_0576105 [Tanacetum coccineum]